MPLNMFRPRENLALRILGRKFTSSIDPSSNRTENLALSTIGDALLRDQMKILKGEAGIIFDVGAHNGRSTLDYLVNFPRAQIFAFEPDSKNYAAAHKALAGYRQRCSLNRIALCDTNGTADFHVNSHSGTHSLLPIGAKEYWAGPAHEVQTVPVRAQTIDSFAEERGIVRIDILKMDIQGAELMALKGARRLLEQSHISLLALEVEFTPLYHDQPLFWDICAFLYQFGYSFFKLYDEFYHPENENMLCWADAIFLAEDRTSLVSN